MSPLVRRGHLREPEPPPPTRNTCARGPVHQTFAEHLLCIRFVKGCAEAREAVLQGPTLANNCLGGLGGAGDDVPKWKLGVRRGRAGSVRGEEPAGSLHLPFGISLGRGQTRCHQCLRSFFSLSTYCVYIFEVSFLDCIL